MSKDKQNYLFLTVHSQEDAVVIDANNPKHLNDVSYVKMELETGIFGYEDEIRISVSDDDDNLLAEFFINDIVAQYIQNYIKTYLQIINN